ncbi:XRE family transcriptional regulator [Mongoliimonas terrestris]|uniref:XRE family transcriptional regulator n=1 Tax=Mongoliimonas terrestris TaxID=1709001 RepID=UPI0009495030|nr:helix-turn-helix transcriptional regulator [Mongoliimonas terrestris]
MSTTALHQMLMKEQLGQVLRNARKRKGMVLRQVAEAVGVSPQAVGQWERGQNDISMENLRSVAQVLGIDPVAANRGEIVELGPIKSGLPNEAERVTEPSSVTLGPRSVPVLGVTVGGEDADFYMNGDVVDYVRRPPGAEQMRKLFALHVLGDSMVPRYDPGELVYCGGRAPVPGDYVVIEMHPQESSPVGKCFLKKMKRRAGGRLICEQFNPPMELSFDLYEIKAIHRVIPLSELLGF